METHRFPSKITISRALLLADQKTPDHREVFPKEFIESVIRYGLTSPMPIIIKEGIQYISETSEWGNIHSMSKRTIPGRSKMGSPDG